MPVATPVTVPAVLTDATAPLLVLHAPPLTPSVSVVVEAGHTVVVPLIVPADGRLITVIVLLTIVVPHELLAV